MAIQMFKPVFRRFAKLVMRVLYWEPITDNKLFRACIFDSAKPNIILLSDTGKEYFLVSSNDKAIGREVYVRHGFDFEKFQKILSLLDTKFKPALLLDIGANIGTICIPAVKRGLFSKAIAFEPEPFNYSLLCANVALNALTGQITTYNFALGKVSGEKLQFELSNKNYGDHRVSISKVEGLDSESGRDTILVNSESLDSMVADINASNTLIWIDTQGFEGFVLEGAKAVLKNCPPLVIEFWPYGMSRTGSFKALKREILQAGYSEFYDLNQSPLVVARVSDDAFENLYLNIGVKGNFTDLLLIQGNPQTHLISSQA